MENAFSFTFDLDLVAFFDLFSFFHLFTSTVPSSGYLVNPEFFGNKAKGRISKRVFQDSKFPKNKHFVPPF